MRQHNNEKSKWKIIGDFLNLNLEGLYANSMAIYIDEKDGFNR